MDLVRPEIEKKIQARWGYGKPVDVPIQFENLTQAVVNLLR